MDLLVKIIKINEFAFIEIIYILKQNIRLD